MLATLIFDLDGTLSDPVVGIGRSMNYALEALGYHALAAADVSRYVGPPLEQSFRDIAPDAPEPAILALVAKFRERYLDVGCAENVVYPGIPDALEVDDARCHHGRLHVEAHRRRRTHSRALRPLTTFRVRRGRRRRRSEGRPATRAV